MPKLYKGSETSPFIHPIDIPGWLAKGWKLTTEPVSDLTSFQLRQADLEVMSWRDLKAIAEPLGIEKPEGGWDEVIPFILKAEWGDPL